MRERSASAPPGCPYCMHLGSANAALLLSGTQDRPLRKSRTHIEGAKDPNDAKFTAALRAFVGVAYGCCRMRRSGLRAFHAIRDGLLARGADGGNGQFLTGESVDHTRPTEDVPTPRDTFKTGSGSFRDSWRMLRRGCRCKGRFCFWRVGSEKF